MKKTTLIITILILVAVGIPLFLFARELFPMLLLIGVISLASLARQKPQDGGQTPYGQYGRGQGTQMGGYGLPPTYVPPQTPPPYTGGSGYGAQRQSGHRRDGRLPTKEEYWKTGKEPWELPAEKPPWEK